MTSILVVDDVQGNRDLAAAILSAEGYEVSLAVDGYDALEQIATRWPDVIVVDAMMPRLDGFELTQRIRAMPEGRGVPILMLTALRERSNRIRGLDSGADDYLTKPFDRVELLARVRSLLRIAELHSQLEQRNALLHQVLTRYMSESVANEILANPLRLQLGGDSRRISVLFADIRGFTRFAEAQPPQVVIGLLNRVWERIVPLIYENQGTFDKYLGDAVMAIYGAPIPQEDAALRAVRTAQEIHSAFAALRADEPLLATMGLGIGIVTGDAVVGNVGSERVMDYTAIGSVPNLAHRFQERAQGGQTYICATTNAALGGVVMTRPIEPLALRGFDVPVPAFELLACHECEAALVAA